ncbi:hypothetical protein [Okeania hirsuta]|uniref:hypothetical protein n=1 Tax=Okeania hirsuta TaxID=1458930 RepID=UPI00137519B6|nr:hypothetical protein [Okeania hirsuta]
MQGFRSRAIEAFGLEQRELQQMEGVKAAAVFAIARGQTLSPTGYRSQPSATWP